MTIRFLFALGLLLSVFASTAAPPPKGTMTVSDGFSYETPAPGVTAAGYLSLHNLGKRPDRLLRIESPWANSVEIHEMSMAGGVMKMRALGDGVGIGGGQTVALAPGGFHLMLFGTRQALARGDAVPLMLHFKRAGTLKATLMVRERPAAE